MNNLSWFLYLTDVSQSLSSVAAVTSGSALVAAVILVFTTAMRLDVCHNDTTAAGIKASGIYLGKWIAGVLVVALLLSIFLPQKNTMYAIAASEIGERVIKTPEVQGIASDATKALHSWIKKQIETEDKK